MRCASRCASVICAVVAAGCVGDTEGSASSSARDSAGVRIIDIAAPLDTVRVVSTSGAIAGTDALPIGALLDVRFVSASTVAVADGMAQSILLVDASSGSARMIGREGRGPGEFSAVHFIQPGDGGVWVFDPMLLRLTLIDSSGTFVRARSETPQKPQGGDFVMRFHVGVMGGKLVAMGRPQRETDGDGTAWGRAPVLIEDDQGHYREIYSFRTGRCAPDKPDRCTPDQSYRNGQLIVGGNRLIALPCDRMEAVVLTSAGEVEAIIRSTAGKLFPERVFVDQSDRVWLNATNGDWVLVDLATGKTQVARLPDEVLPRDAMRDRVAGARLDGLNVSTVEVLTLGRD